MCVDGTLMLISALIMNNVHAPVIEVRSMVLAHYKKQVCACIHVCMCVCVCVNGTQMHMNALIVNEAFDPVSQARSMVLVH